MGNDLDGYISAGSLERIGSHLDIKGRESLLHVECRIVARIQAESGTGAGTRKRSNGVSASTSHSTDISNLSPKVASIIRHVEGTSRDIGGIQQRVEDEDAKSDHMLCDDASTCLKRRKRLWETTALFPRAVLTCLSVFSYYVYQPASPKVFTLISHRISRQGNLIRSEDIFHFGSLL